MKRIKRIVYAMNDYFFEIEPDEAPDYVGAALFYGVITLMLGVGVILTVATIFGG